MGRGRLCAALAVALLAAVLAGSAGGSPAHGVAIVRNGADQQYVPGQVVVGFRPNVDPVTRRLVVANADAKTVNSMPRVGAQVLHVQGSVESAIADLESNPAVAYAEPNWIYHADAVPNDPRYSQDYGLARIQAPQAWDVTTGSPDVTVAVVDTGIATDHLDLSANVVPGYDFVQDDADPRDFNGHGTHVAGTIGAKGNNGIGVAGVNWNVQPDAGPRARRRGQRLEFQHHEPASPTRARTARASSTPASAAGGYYDADGAGDRLPRVREHALRGRRRQRRRRQRHDRRTTPATTARRRTTCANVICVAATDQNDVLASFSNYGPTSVDLAAPGVPSRAPGRPTTRSASEGFEDPFTNWTTYTARAAFNRSPQHANGAFSTSDSPGGNYAPEHRHVCSTAPRGEPQRTDRLPAAYNLRLDTQSIDDYFSGVDCSADGFDSYVGIQWSGSTRGSFLALTTDFSALDGAAAFFPALRLTSNADSDGRRRRLPRRSPAPVPEAERRGLQHDQRDVDGDAARRRRGGAGEAAHPAVHDRAAQGRDARPHRPAPGLNGKVATGGRLNACRAVGGAAPRERRR